MDADVATQRTRPHRHQQASDLTLIAIQRTNSSTHPMCSTATIRWTKSPTVTREAPKVIVARVAFQHGRIPSASWSTRTSAAGVLVAVETVDVVVEAVAEEAVVEEVAAAVVADVLARIGPKAMTDR